MQLSSTSSPVFGSSGSDLRSPWVVAVTGHLRKTQNCLSHPRERAGSRNGLWFKEELGGLWFKEVRLSVGADQQ